jgi:hypothetical protein
MELSEDLKKAEASAEPAAAEPSNPEPAGGSASGALNGAVPVLKPLGPELSAPAVEPAGAKNNPGQTPPLTDKPAEDAETGPAGENGQSLNPAGEASLPAVDPSGTGKPEPETADVSNPGIVKPINIDSETAQAGAPEPAGIKDKLSGVNAGPDKAPVSEEPALSAKDKPDLAGDKNQASASAPAAVASPAAPKEPAKPENSSAIAGPVALTAETRPHQPSFEEQLKSYRRTIIVKAHAKRRERVEENIKKIMAFTRENGRITNDGVERLIGVKDSRAGQYLKKLIKEKKLVRFGAGRKIHYKIAPGA